jgi:SHS2 domain-containing protein
VSGSWEVLEHTAEVKLRLRGASLAALFVAAGRALATVELGSQPPLRAAGEERTVEVRAADVDALLVEWLNELVYLAETARQVPVEFTILAAGTTELRARVRGVPVALAPARVKGATFHGLKVEMTPAGWEADVVLDV